jgi:hypothetical protein
MLRVRIGSIGLVSLQEFWILREEYEVLNIMNLGPFRLITVEKTKL